jgi:type I restriction enzyme S subunit
MELNEPSAKYLVQGGLQQTEIGPIPLDWQVEPLAKVAEIRSGIAKNVNAVIADAIEVPYLRVANVQDGYLDLQEISTIRINREDLRRYSVLPFDVLMNEGGDIDKLGRGALWRGQIQPCVHQNHVFVVRCKPALAPQFLSAWSASPPARRYFLFAGKQTTNLASINKTSLGQLPVAMPRLREEQERIAQALADADALIESLEQLLSKKRQIKQGAMQDLLTGQRRLPGFQAEWCTVSLGEIGTFLKGSGITREQAQSGAIPCVRYGEIYTTHTDHVRSFESGISPAVAATATPLRQGDILFAGSGETKEDIGKCVAFLDDFEAYAGGDIVILRPRAFDSRYLGYALNAAEVNRQKASKGQGDAVVHISAAALAQITVRAPEIAGQTAIATILSDMDTEITALEARLTKARQLKQGMAQALLTGRIRLV